MGASCGRIFGRCMFGAVLSSFLEFLRIDLHLEHIVSQFESSTSNFLIGSSFTQVFRSNKTFTWYIFFRLNKTQHRPALGQILLIGFISQFCVRGRIVQTIHKMIGFLIYLLWESLVICLQTFEGQFLDHVGRVCIFRNGKYSPVEIGQLNHYYLYQFGQMGNCLRPSNKTSELAKAPAEEQHFGSHTIIPVAFNESSAAPAFMPETTHSLDPSIHILEPPPPLNGVESQPVIVREPQIVILQSKMEQHQSCSQSCQSGRISKSSSKSSGGIISPRSPEAESIHIGIGQTQSEILGKPSQRGSVYSDILGEPSMRINPTQSYMVDAQFGSKLPKSARNEKEVQFQPVNSQLIVSHTENYNVLHGKEQNKNTETTSYSRPNFEQSKIIVRTKIETGKVEESLRVHQNIEQSAILINTKKQDAIAQEPQQPVSTEKQQKQL